MAFRPIVEPKPDEDDESLEATTWRGPSKSQRKRDADRVALLGRKLVELAPSEVAQFELDDELSEAIALGRTLKKGARSRQLRLIAKLLRERDTQALAAAVHGGAKQTRDAVLEEQEHQHWRLRLLNDGEPALEAFSRSLAVEITPDERRELRQLIRAGRKDPPDTKSQRAKLLLLRKIRALGRARVQPTSDNA